MCWEEEAISKILLTSTLHDPYSRLLEPILSLGRALQGIFASISVVVTPRTAGPVCGALKESGFRVVREESDIVVDAYRRALNIALDEEPGRFLYVDFDRLLHWVRAYPEELTRTVETLGRCDFLLVGRTGRALLTHPPTQLETEAIANTIGSYVLGFRGVRDIISVCWGLTDRVAEAMVQTPVKNTYGFFCEWPAAAWRAAERPIYVEVEGLEWETPDRFGDEIATMGYERWLEEFQTPEEWRKRVSVLRDAVASLLKYDELGR